MQWRISALVMLHLRVLLPMSVNPDTRNCLYSLVREYFAEDSQIVKPVAGLYSDVCCRIKVRGRHGGTYSKSRKRGAANHNGEENTRRRTEVGGTAGKFLHKLRNLLYLLRYYTGYNEGFSIRSVG